jgi:hypothetical protein
MRIPIKGYTFEQLEAQTTPAALPGGNLEAYHQPYYDTQTYLAAGSGELTYFQTVSNDRSLSNMEAQGQFPDPKFFRLFGIMCDIILPNAVDAWDDMVNLISVGRPTLALTISDKLYGPIPLQMCHTSGGIQGFGVAATTVAATTIESQWANNGIQDGGFSHDGAILIPPKIGFSVNVRWGNAQAVANDTLIRIILDGVIYRRIL